MLGGAVRVPTPSGPVNLKLPPNSNSGRVFRLTGRGVRKRGGQAGDVYVTVKIVLPDAPDEALTAFGESWVAGMGQNPRTNMEG